MNPASRLHSLLLEFRKFKKNPAPQLRVAIAEIFSIQDPKSLEVFRAYVSVINLTIDVEERLASVANLNHQLYKRSINGIQRLLSSANIDRPITEFQNGLKDTDLHGLEFVSDCLGKVESEKEISREDLAKFEQQIDSLIEEIRNSGVSTEFIHFLVSHLFIIRTSIQNYRFFGSVGMKASLARVLGEILLDPSKTTRDEEKTGLLKKVLSKIKDINAILVFIRNGVEIRNTLDWPDKFMLGG